MALNDWKSPQINQNRSHLTHLVKSGWKAGLCTWSRDRIDTDCSGRTKGLCQDISSCIYHRRRQPFPILGNMGVGLLLSEGHDLFYTLKRRNLNLKSFAFLRAKNEALCCLVDAWISRQVSVSSMFYTFEDLFLPQESRRSLWSFVLFSTLWSISMRAVDRNLAWKCLQRTHSSHKGWGSPSFLG